MAFAPDEVAAGVTEVLERLGVATRSERRGDRLVLRADGLVVSIGPVSSGGVTALFGPRTLLVVRGEGDVVEALKAAIRPRFLRVMG